MKLICAALVFMFSTMSLAEMKGLELYCVLDNAKVKYMLLPGTNRLKNESEIVNHKELMTLAELSKKLKKREKSENILIEGGGLKDADSKLILPPKKDLKKILLLCHSRQLNCQLTQ